MEAIIRDLLYDAFFLFSTVESGASLLDVGSGNGVLAITFACLDENVQVYPVDKNLKKIQFQRHIKRSLKLPRLLPVHGRIETLEPLNVDTVVAKGFAPTTQVLEKVSIHLLKEGRAYLLKGVEGEEAARPGFVLDKTISYRLPQSSKQYRLLLYKKIS
jgi:16S rRNA (guanine527-N7)-methyltransferase